MKLAITYTALGMIGEVAGGNVLTGESRIDIFKQFVILHGMWPTDPKDLEEGDKPLDDFTEQDYYNLFEESVEGFGISIVSIFDTEEGEFIHLLGYE